MTSDQITPKSSDGSGGDVVGLLAVGGQLVDFEILDHAGNSRQLSHLIGGDPTVVQFYRGWWCPKEQTFFRRLLALQDDAEVAYSRILSVSVDPPEVNAAFRAGLGARWTFLSDTDREVQKRLQLRETTDTLHDPYVPVRRDQRSPVLIRYGTDHGGRANTSLERANAAPWHRPRSARPARLATADGRQSATARRSRAWRIRVAGLL